VSPTSETSKKHTTTRNHFAVFASERIAAPVSNFSTCSLLTATYKLVHHHKDDHRTKGTVLKLGDMSLKKASRDVHQPECAKAIHH